MQTHDSDPSKLAPHTFSAAHAADRMGLTTRQLQDLRLQGIGPQIVQRGLSIHYELADRSTKMTIILTTGFTWRITANRIVQPLTKVLPKDTTKGAELTPQLGHNSFPNLTESNVNFMVSRQAKIQEDTNFRVMRILQDDPDLTQRELADKLGVSVGGLNYCLKALMERGWVKMQNFNQSKNKFGYVYLLTPAGISERTALASRFLKRKMEEYEALRTEIKALKSEEVKRGSVRTKPRRR